MNTAEHIIEIYMRLVKKSFTIVDVKVERGNNRQLDILSFDLQNNCSYHIESTATHRLRWKPNIDKLIEIFEKKFLGFTKSRNKRTEPFLQEILSTYREYGIKEIDHRIICVWYSDVSTDEIKKKLKSRLNKKYHKYINTLSIWSLRDKVINSIIKNMGTSNYEDEVLRTISFYREYDEQINKNAT